MPVQLALAAALSVSVMMGTAFWGLERVTTATLQSLIDSDLRTQVREWRTFSSRQQLDTPARVRATATAWLAQQRDHPSAQLQIVELPGAGLIGNHPGELSEELIRIETRRAAPVTGGHSRMNGEAPASAADALRLSTVTPGASDPLRVLTEPIRSGNRIVGYLHVADSLATVRSAQAQLRRSLLLFGGLATLAAVVAALLLTALLVRPLRQLTSVAASVDAGRLGPRVDVVRGPADLMALARVFNRMLDRLQAGFTRQRQFASDASHDLRAPLSVVRAQAELLRTTDDGRRTTRSVAGSG